jgi:hypothetical protein
MRASSADRGIPFRPLHTTRSTGSLDGSHTGIRQHSAGPPGAVGDACSLVWPVVATGHVETCPLPSWRQKHCLGPTPPHSQWLDKAPARGRIHFPGSGEADSPLEGSGEAEPVPLGSDETEPAPLGSDETESAPLGSGESESFPEGLDEAVVMPLIVRVN